jgi:hypothetical protein
MSIKSVPERRRPVTARPATLPSADELDREIALCERNIKVLREKTRMNDKVKVPSLNYWQHKLDEMRALKAVEEERKEAVKET